MKQRNPYEQTICPKCGNSFARNRMAPHQRGPNCGRYAMEYRGYLAGLACKPADEPETSPLASRWRAGYREGQAVRRAKLDADRAERRAAKR